MPSSSAAVSATWICTRASSSTASFGRGDEPVDRQRVGGVRPDADGQPAVAAVEVGVELPGVVQAVLPATGRRRQVEDARGQHAADAGLEGRLGDGAAVQVHLARRGHAAEQQLVAAEQHAPADVVVGHPALERPDRLAQPAVEREAVAGTAQEGHRRVGVRVDEAGHHEPAEGDHVGRPGRPGPLDHPGRQWRRVGRRPGPGDPITVDVEHARSVDHPGAGDQRVGLVPDGHSDDGDVEPAGEVGTEGDGGVADRQQHRAVRPARRHLGGRAGDEPVPSR